MNEVKFEADKCVGVERCDMRSRERLAFSKNVVNKL